MQLDTLTMVQRLGMSTYKLESICSEDIPEGKIYVEDRMSTEWHRHVEQHGPKPEAYARYTLALIALEEKLCSK